MSSKRSSGSPLAVVRSNDVLVQLEPRQGHAPLDAAVQLEQLDLHVDGVRQLRMRLPDRAQLDHFTCL